DCIQCGACESHCPQKIKIIEELQKIDAKYAELEAKGE
ncbi:MAG: 4Fe-4S binding protein, partial [Anaerovoracaceae bacterium]